MDEGSSARANGQVAGRCLFRAGSRRIYWNGSEPIGQKGTLSPGWLRNRVDGKWSAIDRALSFPQSPLCPHWCPSLSSFRLSHPTGFTKLKRDWLFCSNFLYIQTSKSILQVLRALVLKYCSSSLLSRSSQVVMSQIIVVIKVLGAFMILCL